MNQINENPSTEPNEENPINDFSGIALSEELQHGIADMGYDEATSIQSQSIPLILAGNDLIGLSQTGSGKTAAFGLPALEMIDTSMNSKIVQVLILCPTRELAMQASEEMRKFSKYKHGINIVSIYGGDSIERQMAKLRSGCQIVVGTPGRIMDHMRRKTLRLSSVKLVVLDEADEMLNMGFVEDIETILTETPEERQTILFSATMSTAVMNITKKFQKEPKIIKISQKQMTVSTIEQYFFNVPRGKKTAALYRLLEFYKPKSCIIFCNTKKMVDELILDLRNNGYPAQGLHGDMRQSARTQVMNQFKNEQFEILVATDVAARGIDVNDIKIVFNYDLPQEDEYYVHRIGRTGRAGKSGRAFSLIENNRQLAQLRNIMRFAKCDIVQAPLPTVPQIKERMSCELCEQVAEFMEKNDFKPFIASIEKLMGETYSATDVAAALFAMNVKQTFSGDEMPAGFNEFNLSADSDNRRGRSSSNGSSYSSSGGSRSSGGFKKKEYNNENMESIRISIGRNDKISPNHILGAVAGESGLPGKLFGAINIENNYTTIDVPKELKKNIVKKMNKTKIKGKTVTVE